MPHVWPTNGRFHSELGLGILLQLQLGNLESEKRCTKLTVVYCDRSDCIYWCDDECQRTSIKIESDCSHSGAYCASVEIKKEKTDCDSHSQVS